MKKFLALALTLMLVLVNAAAFASDVGGDPPAAPSGIPAADAPTSETDPSVDTGYDKDDAPTTGIANPAEGATTNVTISKHFNVTGTGAKVPAQTVTFTPGDGTVAPDTFDAPEIAAFSVAFAEGNDEKDVTIALPHFPGVGVYTYPVSEEDTNIEGQSYATEIELKITVINGESGLVIAGIALRQNDVKTDTLENDYEANALTVGKSVTGNLGDKTKLFPITVVLKAGDDDKVFGTVGVTITGDDDTEVMDGSTTITNKIAAVTGGWTQKTITLKLKDGQTVKFDNLPVGVTYTVVEDEAIKHATNATDDPDDPDTYKVTGQVEEDTELTEDTTVTIGNEKSIEVDTGITLETLPYVLIMAIALVGAAMLITRRREEM